MKSNTILGILFGLFAIGLAGVIGYAVLFDDPQEYKIFELTVVMLQCYIASKICELRDYHK